MLKMRGNTHIVNIEEFSIKQWKEGGGQDVLIRMELLDCIKDEVFDTNEVVRLGIHICRVLELCDKHAVIHRDIRPHNLFRSIHGNYKLGDFGIIRMTTDGNAPSYASNDNYMAPELLKINGKYDKRADIYSLGLTLYVLLNENKLPFEMDENEDPPNITEHILNYEPMPSLKCVPEWLSQIIQKACSYNPNERYTSANEMRESLEYGYRNINVDEANENMTTTMYISSCYDNIIRHPVKGKRIRFGEFDWRVIEVLEDKALILSDMIVENKSYNELWNNVTWETCTLRHYLNETFLNRFNDKERACIMPTRIINNSNPCYGTIGGNITTDKVFLLSMEEIMKYLGNEKLLLKFPERDIYWISDKHNKSRIALEENNMASWWWLRSPGIFGFNATSVSPEGWLSIDGQNVDNYGGGIRPSMWLNIHLFISKS